MSRRADPACGVGTADFRLRITDSECLNSYASRVQSQAGAQRFECALLGAPKQGQKPRSVRRRRFGYERLLFGGEIISHKTVATWLYYFQITTQSRAGQGDRAERTTGAVAE